MNNMEDLHQSDGIIFGCPTYFGSISTEFKRFIEFTGPFGIGNFGKTRWQEDLLIHQLLMATN